MNEFVLKRGDTLPVLRTVLKNPDGSVHNLTGSDEWKLHVTLPDGTSWTRDMTKVGADVEGTLEYAWQDSDWSAGNLVADDDAMNMEFEVIGGNSRLTIPNASYRSLRVVQDIQSSIWSGLVAGWKMDEQSGSRLDVFGARPFTQHNGVVYASGLIGNAASFDGASHFLTIPNEPILQIHDMVWVVWWNGSQPPPIIEGTLISKNAFDGSSYEYALYFTEFEQTVYWDVHGGAGQWESYSSAWITYPPWDTWVCMICWYDPVTRTANMEVNGILADAWPTGGAQGDPLVLDPFLGPSQVALGGWDGLSWLYTGLMDEVYLFNGPKDQAWRTAIRNNGAGNTYLG